MIFRFIHLFSDPYQMLPGLDTNKTRKQLNSIFFEVFKLGFVPTVLINSAINWSLLSNTNLLSK